MVENNKKGGYIICLTILYIVSACIGIFAMLYADIELKNLLKFIGRGILFWLIAEIIISICTFLINKIFNKEMSEGESQKIIVPYFLFNIGTLIYMAMTMDGTTKILGIIVGCFLFNFIPLVFTLTISNKLSNTTLGNSSNKSNNDNGIKTNVIYDQFGNKIASSTTYNDGITGVEKTYIKDNLGNTIGESTSIDGYSKTKINTTGRF